MDGESDEYNSNERRILRDRSAILLGFKILLAEAYFEDVQDLFGILSGNQGLVVVRVQEKLKKEWLRLHL